MGPVRTSPNVNAEPTSIVAFYKFAETESMKMSPDSTTISHVHTPSNPVIKQRKHSEKRREAWRIGVQKRRSAQADAFHDLRQTLALPNSDTGGLKSLNQLDVLRVAVSFVKLRSVLDFMHSSACTQEDPLSHVFAGNFESLLLLPDGGFLLIVSTTGEIMHVSGNAAKYFGYDSPVILGTNLYHYVEKADVPELNKLLAIREMQDIVPVGIGIDTFKAPTNSARLTLRSGHNFQVTGKVFLKTGLGPPNKTTKTRPGSFFVGVAEPVNVPNPYNSQQLLPQIRVFSTIDWMCSGDLKQMIYSEPQLFLGYTTEEVAASNADPDRSPFDMYFPEDLPRVQQELVKLYKRGRVECSPYRLLARSGGWAWVISHISTIVVPEWKRDGSLQPGTYYAGRDFMISEVFEPQLVLASIQTGYQTCCGTGTETNSSGESNFEPQTEEQVGHWDY